MQFLDTKSCDPDLCLSSCLQVLRLAGSCLLWSRVERRRRMVKGFFGGVRHENAYKDCHAALGRWLVRRYTIEQVESVTSQQCNALSGMCHLAQQPARLLR